MTSRVSEQNKALVGKFITILEHSVKLGKDVVIGTPSDVRSVFESVRAPDWPIAGYVYELHSKLPSASSWMAAMILMSRLEEKANVPITPLTVHRLILVCLAIGHKVTSDYSYQNRVYAEVGGVSLADINMMERTMLKLLDFEVNITSHEAKRALRRWKRQEALSRETAQLQAELEVAPVRVAAEDVASFTPSPPKTASDSASPRCFRRNQPAAGKAAPPVIPNKAEIHLPPIDVVPPHSVSQP